MQFNYDVWHTWCANHTLLEEFFTTGRTPLDTNEFIIPLNLDGSLQLICSTIHNKPAVTFYKMGGSGENKICIMQSTHNTLKDHRRVIKLVHKSLAEDLDEMREKYNQCVCDLAEALEDNNFNEKQGRDFLLAHEHYDNDSIIDLDTLGAATGVILTNSQ